MCLVDLASITFDSDSDFNGCFSKKGKIIDDLLTKILKLELIQSTPPKSMDIVDFGKDLLTEISDQFPTINDYDLIRTLVQATVESIHYNIIKFLKLRDKSFELICSGGGIEHPFIKSNFLDKGYNIKMINEYGIDSSIKEALLIAVLGACRINNLTSNMPSVTGASSNCLLGDIMQVESVKNIFRAYDIRGIVDKEVTNELALNIGKAYGTFLIRNSKENYWY